MLNAKKGRIANNLLSNYLLMRRYNPLKLLPKKLYGAYLAAINI